MSGYDGTTAVAKVTKSRFGYRVKIHEKMLVYGPSWGPGCGVHGWYRPTRSLAEGKGRKELCKYRKKCIPISPVSVLHG